MVGVVRPVSNTRTAGADARPVHVRAPGKINIYLGVGARDDDGYHPLATLFQAVSLYEDVYASHSDTFTMSVESTHPLVDVAGVPTDDRNLALQAARLLATETGYTGGVHLDVRKSVPVAGGMGGGSADAAAALVACNALWGTHLSITELHDLGAQLGADVPFLIMGGNALGTNRGDVLTPVLSRAECEWVLVLGDEGLSTAHIYSLFDEQQSVGVLTADQDPEPLEVPPRMLQALATGNIEVIAEHLHNDLMPAAIREQPHLSDVLRDGESAGALAGLVSGSGPTVAFLCRNAESADRVAAELTRQGQHVLRAQGAVPGARVVAAS